MKKKLNGKKVAVLAANGFEQSELEEPVNALREVGAIVEVISLKEGKIKGRKEKNWGDEFQVDLVIENAKSNDYDILVLPGGEMNPDQLRVNKDVVTFVNEFMESGKLIAAICYRPWTLIETGKPEGKKMKSFVL